MPCMVALAVGTALVVVEYAPKATLLASETTALVPKATAPETSAWAF